MDRPARNELADRAGAVCKLATGRVATGSRVAEGTQRQTAQMGAGLRRPQTPEVERTRRAQNTAVQDRDHLGLLGHEPRGLSRSGVSSSHQAPWTRSRSCFRIIARRKFTATTTAVASRSAVL